jgi:RsiW-degrading membrane proteinase PrsW (M82 family)
MQLLISAPVGLLPVLCFLLGLLYLDSYKLVRLNSVLWSIAGGAAVAVASYFCNDFLLGHLALDLRTYTRYLSPLVEEALKAAVVLYLFRAGRIGFLVDAAIMGFAIGAGFAVAENFYFLYSGDPANVALWIVRGFGTAVMHGGVTAIFAIISQAVTERQMKVGLLHCLPGLAAAVVLHSLFNHFVLPPFAMTASVLIVLPPMLYVVFTMSAQRMHEWLELDFDADAGLLHQINSGEFADSNVGRFLHDLRSRFDGPVLADMVCYLRIYTELALRAKGLLLMREHGLDMPAGERTQEKFAELEYLERSIGKTGLLALRPLLHMTRKDLWQLNVLET